MRLAVAATAPLGADVLERLADKHEIAFLLTRPDRPRGRGRKVGAPPAKETAERLGIPVRPTLTALLSLPQGENIFQQMLFSKIVPNCKKLGLLDAGDGWLRQRFTEIDVIQFEDWADTGEEYEQLDEVAKDRQAVAS